MYKLHAKSILNKLELPNQGETRTNHLNNSLRILARMIARDLLAKHAANTNDNDIKSDNENHWQKFNESLS